MQLANHLASCEHELDLVLKESAAHPSPAAAMDADLARMTVELGRASPPEGKVPLETPELVKKKSSVDSLELDLEAFDTYLTPHRHVIIQCMCRCGLSCHKPDTFLCDAL